MEEKIRTMTHSSDINSMFKSNDFFYSDKQVVLNNYGIPIVKIMDIKPSVPKPKTFEEINLKLRMKSQRNELNLKIFKSTQGLSPISKRRIDRREESQISPLFKKPRETDKEGLTTICDIDTPYYLNKRKVFEDKMETNQKEIQRTYGRHLSTVQDFQKVANAIQNALAATLPKKSSPFKKNPLYSKCLHKSNFELTKMSSRPQSQSKSKKSDSKNKVSMYELEKSFMNLQRQTIESYLKGENVDQNIINKDFMSYILETFEQKAKEKYKLRKKIERVHEIEHSLKGKRFSFLTRPNSAIKINSNRISSARNNGPIDVESTFHHSKTLITKKVPLHHLSVKEEKRQKKINENKKTIEKVRESVVSDLDGLGEVEKKALLKLRRKFVLYNNTNYEILDRENKINFLHRGTDLKTKNLKVFDSEKFRKNKKSPTKIIIGKENLSQYMFYQSAGLNSSLIYSNELANEESAKIAKNLRENEEKRTAEEKYRREGEKIREQENHLAELKEFKKKMETREMTLEETEFLQNIKKNQFNTVYFALVTKPNLVNIVDKFNQTPLHLVAKRGLYEIACLLCEFNPNYQAKDIVNIDNFTFDKYFFTQLGRTPLDLAQATGNIAICKLFEPKEFIQMSAMTNKSNKE